MTNGHFTCVEHSGCEARISNLEHENGEQWTKMEKINDRTGAIFTRVNIVLGGVVVACIMLAINLVLK